MNDNRILSTLKSSNATLAVLVLALYAQTPHAADVFRLIVRSEGWAAVVHSYSFAVALELAVLLFVVQSRHAESYGFACVSIAMNLSYYYLHGIELIAWSSLPALLVSVALPVAIARYSHAVADVHGMQEPVVQPPAPPAPPPHNEQSEDAQAPAQPATDAQPPAIDKRQRAKQMHSEGLTIAQIASELGSHRNTVSAWVRNGVHP